MCVLRRVSNSLQHVKAISLSVVMLFKSTPWNMEESVLRTVARFLLGNFLIHVFFVKVSTATKSTHELFLETMKSSSIWPTPTLSGLSSMKWRPSWAVFHCPRFLPPLWLFQPQNRRYSSPLDSANLYMALGEQMILSSRFR